MISIPDNQYNPVISNTTPYVLEDHILSWTKEHTEDDIESMTITHDHIVKAMAFMNEQSHKLGELFIKFWNQSRSKPYSKRQGFQMPNDPKTSKHCTKE